MRRTLRLAATTLVCTSALLMFGPVERAAAQQFILQGNGLGCDGTDCVVTDGQNLIVNGDGTFGADVAITGDLDVAGHAYFDLLTVETSYWLPECPAGYVRDPEVADYILCEKVLTGGTDRMVKVGDFWVDKYELSAWSSAECTGTQYGESDDNWAMPDNGNWAAGEQAYACSIEGETPTRHMTWFQAEQACALAGKRLCSNAEWQAAAAGTYDPGATNTGNQCVVDSALRATGGAGTAPGATTTCVSMWGADDMIGNVWEFVEDWEVGGMKWQTADGQSVCPSGCTSTDGGWPTGYGDDGLWDVNGRTYVETGYLDGVPAATRRGGDWGNDTRAGVFAYRVADAPSFPHYTIGARCCVR